MSAHWRFACALLFAVTACSLHATVRYTVTLADPVKHLVRVSMELPAGTDSRELQLPVWNALYQVRDFAQFMDNIQAVDPSGHALPLVQLDKSRWRLTGAKDGARIDYEMFANVPGPYNAELNQQHAFFNLAEILLYTDDTRADPGQLEFRGLPSGWRIATPLTQKGAAYEAANYDQLVDSPVEIGAFQEKDFDAACGTHRVVVDSSDAASILSRVVPSIEKIVSAATAWMGDCPFHSYLFLYHFSEGPNVGGMEHAYASVMTFGKGQIKDDLDLFTSVTAHEFFHLWNVKRIRPQSLEPVDYTRENYTDALWFCEGTDTAAAQLILLRAGLIDESRYLDHLSQAITTLENRPAHLTQSAEQASIDAWLEKYPYYAVPDRSISYYNKGELLGVLLDLKMREATGGKASLQTLFRYLNEHYAKRGKFYADTNGVREAVEELTGADMGEFFADYVAGVREIPWNAFLGYIGLRVESVTAMVARPDFDVVQEFDQPPVVARVQAGSEADHAGLKAGDAIVSINGASPGTTLEERMGTLEPGSMLHLRVLRNGVPSDLQWKLGTQQVRIYRVENSPAATPDQKSARAQWLSGTSGSTQ